MEKQSITLECEVSKPDRSATWLKNGEPITPSDHFEISAADTKHSLTIRCATLDDMARYTVRVESVETSGQLIVDGK